MKKIIGLLIFAVLNMQAAPHYKIKCNKLEDGCEKISTFLDEQEVGFVIYRQIPNSPKSYVNKIKVDESCRNQGVASLLMNLAVNRLKMLNSESIELQALPLDKKTSLSKLVNFYEKFGFECTDKWNSESSFVDMKKIL